MLVLLGGFSTASADDFYRVVGCVELTGYDWDTSQEVNDMVLDNGLYKWSKEHVLFKSGKTYAFKVIKNGDYSQGQWPNGSNNWVINSTIYKSGSGYYTVNISFDLPNNSISVECVFEKEPWVVAGVSSVFGANWSNTAEANFMEKDGEIFVLKKTVSGITPSDSDDDKFEYKVCHYNSWSDCYGGNIGVNNNAGLKIPTYKGSFTHTVGDYDLYFKFNEGHNPWGEAFPRISNVSIATDVDIKTAVGDSVSFITDGKISVTRNLHKGFWNSICVPAYMEWSDMNNAFGEGKWKLAEFDGFDDVNNEMKFKSAWSIEANTPYLLWLDVDVEDEDAASFDINTEYIYPGDGKVINPDEAGYKFVGNLAGQKTLQSMINTESEAALYIQGEKVKVASAKTKINSMAAFFIVPKTAMNAREFTFSVDNEPTGIKFVVTGDKVENDNCKIYDLQGRQVEKMQRGVYIVNGKKYVK